MLTGDEQKASKTAAFDLQRDPSAPGLFSQTRQGEDKRQRDRFPRDHVDFVVPPRKLRNRKTAILQPH
jgi:hypothetical protein